MSTFVGYTSDNIPIYQDSGGCFIWGNDGFDYPVSCPSGSSLPPTPIPTYPSGSGSVYIQPGSSWYDDLLNAWLGITALQTKGSVGVGGVNQQKTPIYNSNPLINNPQGNLGSNIGGNLGGSLQSFITQNSMLLLVGGVVFLLWNSGRGKR